MVRKGAIGFDRDIKVQGCISRIAGYLVNPSGIKFKRRFKSIGISP